MHDIGILGLNTALGQRKAGVELAPHVLRQAGLLDHLRDLGHSTIDFGNISDTNPVLNYRLMYFEAKNLIRQCHFPLFLGGDHSVSMASISALLGSQEDLGVIWVDAHGDTNTPQTSPSGNLHGMPLAYLLGLVSGSESQRFSWIKHFLHPSRLVIIGARDLDEGEKELIKRLGIQVYPIVDVKKYGMSSILENSLSYLRAQGVEKIHLSFDLDAVDPEFAPSTGVPVTNGLNLEDVFALGDFISAVDEVGSMDLVELNPYIEPSQLAKSIKIFFSLIERIPYQKIYSRNSKAKSTNTPRASFEAR